MIFLFILFILFLLSLYAFLHIIFKREFIDGFGLIMLIIMILAFVFVIFNIVVYDIRETNILKAQNIHMLPKDILEKNIAVKKEELNDIKEQIKKASDKNQFQVQIKNLNGISIYAMPMSANGTSFQGLGDIEKGGAEKLKLLESLIEKQREIANELIQAQKELSREEYYKRNAEIMVYENSIFDGIVVRWFSIKSNQSLNLIENRVYYPNEK